MRLFKRLFGKSQESENAPIESVLEEKTADDEQWEPVPAFIEADAADYQLVSVIATAIAAGDHPESQFAVKRIMQRNPEARTVSIIAASLAAEIKEESQLVVTSISRKKQ
ncbi:hypothetical protein [Enterococcus sp. JM9B]|uniref:hypothetical protein n=1 Tax=Enterococcus sp. JM9B TaxID=1857216 RepID=UPI001374D20D|nr:hypothetical protein [Enterococcus sp. JM9B]KAF1300529.1 hypothetical protein BAU16_12570 [Enterococcus sp. JM9B]